MIKIKAKFSSYFKYTFCYKAQYKGKLLTLYIGGSADDIYKQEMNAEQEFDIEDSQIEYTEENDTYTYEDEDEY